MGPRAARGARKEREIVMGSHYQQEKPGLYRSRNGVVFGVCRGLAEYFDVSVTGVRLAAILLVLLTGFWGGVIAYIVAALLLKPAPIIPFESDSDAEFYNTYAASRTMALQRLKRTFDNLDRRIQRMETIVTARDYDWERRLREGN
jgi:phage shock protein C